MKKQIILIITIIILLLFTFWFFRPGNRYKPNVEIGEVAPEFTASDIFNNKITLTDLRGKYILLEFWFMHCGPCQEDLPKLIALNKKYRIEDLVIIGVSCDTNKNEFLKYLTKNNINWIQILDELENNGIIVKLYNIQVFPTYILIDREGKVIDWKISKVPDIPI